MSAAPRANSYHLFRLRRGDGIADRGLEECGLRSIAQAGLPERIDHHQTPEALSKMSFAILQSVVRKPGQRYHLALLEDVSRSMELIRHKRGTYSLDVEEIAERERPPMIEQADYRKRMKHVKP